MKDNMFPVNAPLRMKNEITNLNINKITKLIISK